MGSITKKKANVYIIIAAVLWGMISIFNRMLTHCGFEQIEVVFIRSFTALIGTFVYVYIKDKKLLRIRIKDIWCFVGSGILSLLFFNVCYFNAMQENISVAAVLLYTAPAFVVVMSSFLFKEKLTLKKCASLVLMIIGCMFVTGLVSSDKTISVKCILYGIGSGIGYALYSIFGRYAINRGYSSEAISLYTFLLASIGCLPLVNPVYIISELDVYALIGAFGIGILCCLLPYIFYTKGLQGVKNGQASVMATIEPVVATVISIMYGDAFGWNSMFGILLVIASIVIINMDNN